MYQFRVLFKLSTNKKRYVLGETIHITGSVISANADLVNVLITDPHYFPVRHERIKVDNAGSFKLDIKFGDKAESGDYEITAISDNITVSNVFRYSNSEFGDKLVSILSNTKGKNQVSFEPKFIRVNKFDTITWINKDHNTHTATSGDPESVTPDKIFDTGFIPPGKTRTIALSKVKDPISFFCALHPWERGVISLKQLYPKKSDKSKTVNMLLKNKRQTKNSIIEQHKKLAKLERHFSDEVISIINYDDIAKIQKILLTIVFWDIKNFSELSETLLIHDELVVDFLHELYDIIKHTIFKYEGSLDKFMGDGTMALFGIPNKDAEGKQSAINAVNTALEMREKFEELKAKWLVIWRPYARGRVIDINLRCGIHTGMVTYGNMGTSKNDQLTAIGTNINIASRFEGAADPDKIVISSQTEMRIRDHFKLNEVDPVNLKNIPGRFQAFEVLSKKTDIL
jgi:class 3 adenylate cyclase/plastocyanin